VLLCSSTIFFLLCVIFDCGEAASGHKEIHSVSLYEKQSQLYEEALAYGHAKEAPVEALVQVSHDDLPFTDILTGKRTKDPAFRDVLGVHQGVEDPAVEEMLELTQVTTDKESQTMKDLTKDMDISKSDATAKVASRPRPNFSPSPGLYHSHLRHQTKMSRKEKRGRRTKAFGEYNSLNKEHKRMSKAEEEVRWEKRKVELGLETRTNAKGKRDLSALDMALEQCDHLKRVTYWTCNRVTCAYHRKCSGKAEKAQCRRDVVNHRKRIIKDKIMEKTNKAMEVANKKKVKELARKGVVQSEKATLRPPRLVH